MIRFDWKDTAKRLPEEPDTHRLGWMDEDPGMGKLQIQDWWDEHFTVYACKLAGVTGYVPDNLFYVGKGEWMSNEGQVYRKGSVTHWDSYDDDRPAKADYPYCSATIDVTEGDISTQVHGNAAGMTIGALAFIAHMADQHDMTIERTMELLRDIWAKFEVKEDDDGEA